MSSLTLGVSDLRGKESFSSFQQLSYSEFSGALQDKLSSQAIQNLFNFVQKQLTPPEEAQIDSNGNAFLCRGETDRSIFYIKKDSSYDLYISLGHSEAWSAQDDSISTKDKVLDVANDWMFKTALRLHRDNSGQWRTKLVERGSSLRKEAEQQILNYRYMWSAANKEGFRHILPSFGSCFYQNHDKNKAAIFMPLCSTLKEKIGSFSNWEEKEKVISVILEYLAFCERHQMVDYGLNPSNVFINEDGDVFFKNFDNARILGSEITLREENTGYQPIEMCFSQPVLLEEHCKCPVYSAGIMLCEILQNCPVQYFQNRPSDGGLYVTEQRQGNQIVYRGVKLPEIQERSQFSKNLFELVYSMLHPNYLSRPSGTEVLEQWNQLLSLVMREGK